MGGAMGIAEERRIYPRPPIVEAVVEFTFQDPLPSNALLTALEDRLKERYGGKKEKQEVVRVSARIEEQHVSTSTSREEHVTFLRTTDGLRLIGCGSDLLSLHVLAPYPGWESFEEQILEAVHALPDDIRQARVSSISVRYIDRLTLPPGAESPADFLTCLPLRPAGLPSTLAAFSVETQTADTETETFAQLRVAGAEGGDAEERFHVTYDLALQRRPREGFALADGKWKQVVDELHLKQREVFEASITDNMRELFQ